MLSDNEKRDILKYLEADKPLPDKYRFLLFADKQGGGACLEWKNK